MKTGNDIIAGMEALARKWHAKGKPRDGLIPLPYIVHPEGVVALLESWGYNEAEDAVTLAVAWGHDLLEDIEDITESEIEAVGGKAVLEGIKMLTLELPKNKKIFDEEYDRLKAEYISRIVGDVPPEIAVVKMADRLCNTFDFVREDRAHAAKYLKAAEALFARLDRPNCGGFKHAENIKKTHRGMWLLVGGINAGGTGNVV